MKQLPLIIISSCLLFSLICKAQPLVNENIELENMLSAEEITDWGAIGRWEFSELFDELEFFEEGSKVWQFGIGFRSDVPLQEKAAALDQLDVKILTPAISLTYEKNIWNNLGLGFTAAGQIWRVPVFKYQYRYYTGGLRLAYHFNIVDELDPYIGLGGTFRYLELSNNETNTHNTKVTAHWLAGLRYYYGEKASVFFEAGNDIPTWFKVGLTRYVE